MSRPIKIPDRVLKKDTPDFILEMLEKNDISFDAFRYRIKHMGMCMYDAANKSKEEVKGKYGKWRKVAEENNIPYKIFHNRVKKLKWDPEHAATLPIDRLRHLTEEDKKILEKRGIPHETVAIRIGQYGWDKERAMTEPVDKRGKDGLAKLGRENGISDATRQFRVSKMKWTREEAATIPVNGSRLVSIELNKQALAIGLKARIIERRLKEGWTEEEACSVTLEEEKARKKKRSK